MVNWLVFSLALFAVAVFVVDNVRYFNSFRAVEAELRRPLGEPPNQFAPPDLWRGEWSSAVQSLGLLSLISGKLVVALPPREKVLNGAGAVLPARVWLYHRVASLLAWRGPEILNATAILDSSSDLLTVRSRSGFGRELVFQAFARRDFTWIAGSYSYGASDLGFFAIRTDASQPAQPTSGVAERGRPPAPQQPLPQPPKPQAEAVREL